MRSTSRILLPVCLAAAFLSWAPRAFAAERGLVAHYRFDKGAGKVARDVGGKGRHGRIQGAKWVESPRGRALEFGGNGYVDCGARPEFNLRKTLTLEACVRAAGRQTRESGIVIKGSESFALTLYKDGYFYFYVSGGGNNIKAPYPEGGGDLAHHVAATYDGKRMRLYIDGALAATKAYTGRINKGKSLFIGHGTGKQDHFKGTLDEVRIFSRALSPQEVVSRHTALAKAGLVVAQANVTAAHEPWIESADYEPILPLGIVTIPNGAKPVTQKVTFKALTRKDDRRVVLRFQSRNHGDAPGGWNHYLGMELNGTRLADYTVNGTPRILNRKPQITVDEGRPYDMPWWGKVGNNDTCLLTFFGPGGNVLDKRIKSDRHELYNFVIDITDLVSFFKLGLDDVVINDKPNELVLSNHLLFEYVKNKKSNIILDHFSVGYVPLEVWKATTAAFLSKVTPLKEAVTLKGAGFDLKIGRTGAMHLVRGEDVYGIESRFSHPANLIGFNALASEPGKNQHAGWKPSAKKVSDRKATVTAACSAYELKRTVLIEGDKARVRDTFTNIGQEPVGILVRHAATTPELFEKTLIAGTEKTVSHHSPTNPTIFITSKSSRLGILAEDTVLRLQLGIVIQPNRARFKADHFGLGAGKSYTFEWVLYPLAKSADYYDLVNRIRDDWKVNYTINGPFEWFHVQQKAYLLRDPERLRKHLKRKNIKVVNLVPWLDYDNMDLETGEMVTREEYKRMIVPAAKVFRSIDPDIRVIGAIESFPVTLSLEATRTVADRLGYKGKRVGYVYIEPKILEGIPGLEPRRLADCFRNPEGKYSLEIWLRGSKQKGRQYMSALAAHHAPGNAQQGWLMEEARFLMEECGLDGLYIDSFSLATEYMAKLRFGYTKWDGHTVDIDPQTGRIERKYLDAALIGAPARAELINYVLKRGGTFVANSYPCARETQSLRTFRFSESEYGFNPLQIGKGEKPPFVDRFAAGHLTSLIGLGYRPVRLRPHDKDNYARIVIKAVITYLRHGGLYYNYSNTIPAEGRGAGGHGPINHMFPITPVELREGYIVGKERTLTAVSGTFVWRNARKPNVLIFDVTGKLAEAGVKLTQEGAKWRVELKLEDWEQIAVIE